MKIPISKNFIGDEEFKAIRKPLEDGWITQGVRVKEFEQRFLDFAESKYAIACSSGTAALHISLITMRVGCGDEVIVPGFTWVATANVVEAVGGVPVFCDIDLDTFNMDVESLHNRITDRTVGIIPVHLFGLCADMSRVQEVARKYNLWVIEDAACAIGSKYGLNKAGTIGDLGCFSFHPRKTVTTGEGGMVITDSDELAQSCDVLCNHGALSTFSRKTRVHNKSSPPFSQWGLNYRMTDFQGAIGVAQMGRIEFLLSERLRCVEYYETALADISWLRLPGSPEGYIHSWQSYVVLFEPESPSLDNVVPLHDSRNGLMQILKNAGIEARHGTHAPVHLPYYKSKYNSQYEDYPNAWLADQLSIALPIFPAMTEQELDHVVKQIKSFQPAL